uniref:Uncharacterized protein n=1 Tax=Hordeum vulgare subsp. vulgare TaxID=112509 RepID=A0A8I6XXV8_HORVV
MAGKRKAEDNLTGTRHPAARARTDTRDGEDLVGTSAQTSGRTENAAGHRISGTLQALAGLTAATTGSAGGFSQSGGAARGAGGGFSQSQSQSYRGFSQSYRGFSQSQSYGRAPQMPSQGMLRPPLGYPAGGRPPFLYQYHAPTGHGFFPGQNQIAGPMQRGTGQPQMPSQGMLRPPLHNPAGGRPPFTHQYHAPNGHGQLPSQNQTARPLQTGTGPPRGHTGSGVPSSAISCASAAGALVGQECPRCKKPMIVFSGLGPVCADCYTNLVVSKVLQKNPEIRCVHPRPVPSHGGAPRGAAAIRPSSSSSSSSALGSGPICQTCGHPFRLFCLLCFDKDPALSSDDSCDI